MEFVVRRAEVLHDGRLVRISFVAPTLPSGVGPPDWRPGWIEGLRVKANAVELEPLGVMALDWTLSMDQCWTIEQPGATLDGHYIARVAYVNEKGDEVEFSAMYAEFRSRAFNVELTPGLALVLRLPNPVPAGYFARVYLSGPEGDGTKTHLALDRIPAGTETCTISAPPKNGAPAPQPITNWVLHMLAPEQQPFARDEPVSIVVPTGLLRENGGTTTAAATIQAQNNSWVGPDGFTHDSFSQNALVVHVSSSRGLDSNPGSPTSPLKTVAQAFRRIKPNTSATIRLLRGDTFRETNWRPTPALDPTHPTVLEDFWQPAGNATDPGTRPVINATDKPPIRWHPGHAKLLGSYLFRRLHFQKSDVQVMTAFHNLVFDDCTFENSSVSSQCRGERNAGNVSLLRCTHFDATSDGQHVQGFFCHYARRVLVSQCTFDRNGYPKADFSRRDIYCHNIYLQNSVGEAAVWGNWLLRGGSHGVQLRSHGLIARNVLGLNALGSFIKMGGTQSMNIYFGSDDIAPNARRGSGAGMQASAVPSYAQRVEGCLFLHARGGQPRAVILGDIEGDLPDRKYFEEVRYNLVCEHGAALWMSQTAFLTSVHNNLFIASSRMPLFVLQGNVDCTHLRSDGNMILLPPDSHIVRGNGLQNTRQWVANGQDQHSTIEQTMDQPVRFGLADYAKAEGLGNTEASLFAALRQRPPRQWPVFTTTGRAYNAFLDAYRPRDLTHLAVGPWFLRTEPDKTS